jgi:hypothetical protein
MFINFLFFLPIVLSTTDHCYSKNPTMPPSQSNPLSTFLRNGPLASSPLVFSRSDTDILQQPSSPSLLASSSA